jgi:transcriptional regulator
VRLLIESYPLAWIVPGDPLAAGLMPLIGQFGEDDALLGLIGHYPRHSPLHDALAADGRATLLFNGPSGYISPEQAERRDWAPTWVFAQARVRVDVRFDPSFTGEAIDILVARMERERRAPWSTDELGARYDDMVRQVIGFRAEVREVRGRFKLGQDETPETLAAILRNLEDPVLADWMRRFNADRL